MKEMLVMNTSHTCRSLASTKGFPYFCSHHRRPRSVQTLTSPTSSLEEILFRNHAWNTDGLQGEEPPQQHRWDRWDRWLTHTLRAGMSTSSLPQPMITTSPMAPCCLPIQSKLLQFWSYLGHWCTWTKFIKSKEHQTSVRLAMHDTAMLILPKQWIHAMPTPVWLWTLMFQTDVNLHITNLSYPQGNTSYLEQSFLISDPKL